MQYLSLKFIGSVTCIRDLFLYYFSQTKFYKAQIYLIFLKLQCQNIIYDYKGREEGRGCKIMNIKSLKFSIYSLTKPTKLTRY